MPYLFPVAWLTTRELMTLPQDLARGVERALQDAARAAYGALDGLAQLVDGLAEQAVGRGQVAERLRDSAARPERLPGDSADRADSFVHGLQEAFENLRVAVNGRERAVSSPASTAAEAAKSCSVMRRSVMFNSKVSSAVVRFVICGEAVCAAAVLGALSF